MPAPKNPLKAALAGDRPLLGCWLGFAAAGCAEALALSGYDWLVIDGEHAPNDLRSTLHQLQVLGQHAAAPVVRLPAGETWMIKQALDIGAQSLLIPMVECADAARDLVAATRYPPEGKRGVGAMLARASDYGHITDYETTAASEICLIVQVESRAGLDALDGILSVDGVDGVFIGPADLSADMGHLGDPGAKEVQDAIRGALRRIAASGKAAGVMATDLDLLPAYAADGARFLATDIDVALLRNAASARLKAARSALT